MTQKADFFLGDVTMTWERLQAVEFSFLTLADSGAFLTHAPDKLSETLAIIRPFRWEVNEIFNKHYFNLHLLVRQMSRIYINFHFVFKYVIA